LRRQRDFAASRFDHIEYATEAIEETPALGSRFHPPVSSIKERSAEVFLQFLDLVADRGLRQMQFLGRQREALQPRGRFERPE
jgi:hypothetical protein